MLREASPARDNSASHELTSPRSTRWVWVASAVRACSANFDKSRPYEETVWGESARSTRRWLKKRSIDASMSTARRYPRLRPWAESRASPVELVVDLCRGRHRTQEGRRIIETHQRLPDQGGVDRFTGHAGDVLGALQPREVGPHDPVWQ